MDHTSAERRAGGRVRRRRRFAGRAGRHACRAFRCSRLAEQTEPAAVKAAAPAPAVKPRPPTPQRKELDHLLMPRRPPDDFRAGCYVPGTTQAMLSPRRETRRRTCIAQTFTSAIFNPTRRAPQRHRQTPVDVAIRLTPLGTEGDEQAEKATTAGLTARCATREHYAHWREQFPAQAEQFAPGLRREYLHRRADRTQCVYGRHLPLGRSADRVTQPRSPCFKLNYHFAIEDISVLMQQSGRCGWLYRVVSPGAVSGDRPLELAARNSDVSVAEAIAIARHMPFDAERYRRLLAVAGLSASWARPCSRGLPKGASRTSTAACSAVEIAGVKR